MRITNRLGLPESFVRAVEYDDYTGHGTLSVTSLLVPTQALVLARRHDEEIEEDAASRVWLLLGSAAHEVLRRSKAGDEDRIEERLSTTLEIGGESVVVSGAFDLLSKTDLLDFKVTSAYVVMNDKKLEDWWLQLSMYRALCAVNGIETSGNGSIIAILRDWSLSKAKQGGDYPEFPVVVKDFDLMDPIAGINWLRRRASAYVAALKLSDAELPACTPTERIQQPTQWAVYKGSNKRATKLFDDKESANAFAVDLEKARVEERPGRFVRCDDYCSAAPWCAQLRKEANDPSESGSLRSDQDLPQETA